VHIKTGPATAGPETIFPEVICMNISDEIKRLHELHQAGALSDAEFEQAKAKLLNASLNFNHTNDSGSTGSKSSTNSNSSNNSNNIANDISQLRRSKGDRWLGGVCGGLGKATGMDSWIWRLVFALFTVSLGFGLVIYLLLWIFIPEE
jgi:phage shock protein PspC (stress-responsive transcriptional regulator)